MPISARQKLETRGEEYLYWVQAFTQHHKRNPGSDPGHDLAHVTRVWSNCFEIAREEEDGVDLSILAAMAFFHDFCALPKGVDREGGAAITVAAASATLSDLAFPQSKLKIALDGIQTHRFSSGLAPNSREAAILQDADRLDAIGGIGIARLFYVAGQMGSQIYSTDDPFAEQRPLDGRAFALDHFREKLFRVPDRMNTPCGKRLALQRLKPLKVFLDSLAVEITCSSALAPRPIPS
ncbi:MAG: HD domain-containing protein [Pirellulaceae bacterium]